MSTTLSAPPVTPPSESKTPVAILAAWAVVAAAAATMGVVLQGVWAATPDMNDRFLIPCASAWLIYRQMPRWRATPSNPSFRGLPLVAVGAAAFVPAWYLVVQVGPRVILQWWLMAALVAATLGVATLHFGWGRAKLLVFPLLFCFFALPVPDLIYHRLQRVLQECTTRAAVTALPAVGVPAVRNGYVLTLPSGDLGVVEACSGVRSVTALAAIAVLVAHLRGFSLLRGALLFALTFGIVVVSNSTRVIATGLLQHHFGHEAIEGWRHEALGISVVLTGLALIVWVSKLIAPRAPAAEAPTDPVSIRPGVGGVVAAAILSASLAGCVWAEQFRDTHRETVRLEELPQELDGWAGREHPIDKMVAEMLKCDQLLYRVYTNRLGQDVHVYVMFWATPAHTGHMHHPDVCWPCRGFQPVSSRVRPVSYSDGVEPLPVSVRLFSRGNDRQMVYYWSQSANTVLPDGPDDWQNFNERAWLLEMLCGGRKMEQVARMSILVATDLATTPEQQEKALDKFTGSLADALYRQCPWARPQPAK